MEQAYQVEKNQEINKFNAFLESWDKYYDSQAKKIALFDQNVTSKWNPQQREYFVKILYHQRAHFDDVLWYMGNFAPNSAIKEMILDNIRDEFGKEGRSHEQLYLAFAKDMGVDLTYELLEEKFYLPFLKDYNRGHLQWLREHDWAHCLSAFAALERLDNLDYKYLKNTIESFAIEKIDLLFFKVHIYVKHFNGIQGCQLNTVFSEKAGVVENVFNFIGNYQINIWQKISDAVCRV